MKLAQYVLILVGFSTSALLAQTNVLPLTGNVGIGTTNPGYALEVEGSFKGGGRSRVELNRTAFGGTGDTVAIGSFSSDVVGKNIRIYLKGHNGGVIDVHTYEINEVAYIGASTNWLEVPINQNSVSYIGSAAYALDVYRLNINSPYDALFVRVRVKRPVGTGNIQLVIEYDDDVTFTPLSDNNTVTTQFNGSTSPAGGPADGYYGSLEWMFPVSNGQGWANANNQGLFVKNSGNVGIGTSNPYYKLAVSGGPLAASRTGSFVASGYDAADLVLGSNAETRNGYGQANGSHIMLKSSTKSTITALDEGENLGQISYQNLKWTIGEDVGWGPQTISIPGNVGIGTTNPTHKLAVNGTIKAKEVIVETTGWSDYVFAADYALAPLSEVEAHIKEHKHLPGIPSATQVAELGVSVGDMQARLLAKIEELTLHQIAQEKRLQALEAENATLKKQRP